MTCEEVFARLDDYVDRELSAEELREVEAHLEWCAMCTREYAFESTVVRMLKERVRRIEAPPDLKARVFTALGH